MKKILSCMGALLALCLTFSVSAQTLLYDAAGSGATFAKVGGTQDYTLNLNENVVVDGKIVMTTGKKAVEIANADLANVTVVMLVSNINTAIEGQFMAIGLVGLRTVLPTLPATTMGGVKGTWEGSLYNNATGTVNLPTDLNTTTVTYAYSKASGSTCYINGAQSFNSDGLRSGGTSTANILLGGKSKTNSDNLNVGMLIHRVQIYEAKLNATQVATAETAIKAAIVTPDAPLFTPVVPVAGDGKWYFVKSQRSAGASGVSSAMNVPNWWTVQEDGKVIPNAMTQAENQQFQVVATSNGNVTFKVKDGEKTMSNVSSRPTFTDTEKTDGGWVITPGLINGVQGVSFPGEEDGIHQGESGKDWELMTNWYDLTDNCTFFFYEETPDFSIRFAIEDARALVGTAFVGTDLGCVPQKAIDTYRVAIKAAEFLLGSDNVEAIAAATTALTAATTAFRAAKVALDTNTNEPTYYYIVSKNTEHNYSLGQVIYTTGENTQCLWGPNTTPTLNMLFRFEKHAADNTYRIINAAFSDGNLVGVNNGTTPTYWTIEELTGLNGPQFAIKGNGTLHAQGAGNKVVNWGGGYGSASAWTFAPVEGGIASIFQAQYDALVAEYATMADANGNATSAYPLGTAVGEYDETMFGTMKTAYAAMVADMDGDKTTLTATIGATTTAIAAFKASRVQPIVFNGPIGMTAKYTLQYVNSASSKNNYYLTNPRTNDDEDPRVHTTLSAEYSASTCDWRFLPSLTNHGKFILWNDRGEDKKEYFDEELRICTGTTKGSIDDNQWTTKTLLQSEVTWDFETSYLVIKIDQNNNYFYVNDTNGDVRKNSTNYSFFKLTLLNATTVDEATQSVRATVVNGTIEVGGAQTIDVYTITGLQVENKNLKPGVYVAKANGVTYKVAVK